MLIIWKWEWQNSAVSTLMVDDDGKNELQSVPDHKCHSDINKYNDEDVHDEIDDDVKHQYATHTLTFKCMGSTHDIKYQETLKIAREMRLTVPAQLVHEPNNIQDSQAIRFELKVNEEWKPIAYILHEVLQEVHEAISTNAITGIKLAWVKYISWMYSQPGYYAGIKCLRYESGAQLLSLAVADINVVF